MTTPQAQVQSDRTALDAASTAFVKIAADTTGAVKRLALATHATVVAASAAATAWLAANPVAPPPPPPPPPTTTMPGPNAYPGFTQVLADDFLGTSLNETTWNGFYQDINQQFGPFLSSHGSVANSIATLSNYVDAAADGAKSGTNRAGTGLSTRVGYTSGIALVRARCDGGTGVTMCLGMIGLDNWPPELDLYEDGKGLNNTRLLFQASTHWGADNEQEYETNSSTDATQWHTYGVEWNASTISYLVDGVVWYTKPNPDTNPSDPNSLVQPMKLFMQIETLDWGSNNVPVNASTPAVVNMQVDWATVYTPA
jgi:beta-glucanase (GH16 family)